MLPPDPKKLLPGKTARPATEPALPPVAPSLALEPRPASPPPALSAPPSLGTLLQAFRRCWGRALCLGLLGGLLAGGIGWVLVPGKYVAQATLRLPSRPRASWEGEIDFSSYARAQLAQVKSYSVVQKALAKEGLLELGELAGREDPAAWVQSNLVTDNQQAPELVRVIYSGENPNDVAQVVNEVCRAYQDEVRAKDRARSQQRKKELKATLQGWSDQLREKRRELNEFLARRGLDDAPVQESKLQMAHQALAEAQTQLRPAQMGLQRVAVELEYQQARKKALEAGPGKSSEKPSVPVPESAVDDELRQNPVYPDQVRILAALEATIQEVRRVVNPGEEQTRALRKPLAERDTIRATLESMRQEARTRAEARALAKARTDADEAISRLGSSRQVFQNEKAFWEEEIRKARALIKSLREPPLEKEAKVHLDELRDQVNQLEIGQRRVVEELASLEVESQSTARIPDLDPAPVPLSRSLKQTFKAAGAAGFGLFGLIVVGLTLLESRARRVYGAEDVVQGLGLSVVGKLPALPAPRRTLPAPDWPTDPEGQGALVEAIDAIRTVLLHSPRGEGPRIIMVSSAQGGEGKTTLASHLAASLARAWRKTLLIDCDLRNPAAHRQFDLPAEPGFCEGLRLEVEFEDVIRPTVVSRLWLLPAGKCDSHALQALAQEEVGAVFARLREQYDFIVLDTSPVLPVADALLVGQHADAVLFSVLRDVSRIPAVHAAQQRLLTLGIRMLGAVVIGEKAETYGAALPYARHSAS